MSQQLPVPGKDVVIDAVLVDLKERVNDGIDRYGRPLETFNGRKSLQDAYEEALDLVMYLKQTQLQLGDLIHSIQVLNYALGEEKASKPSRLYCEEILVKLSQF